MHGAFAHARLNLHLLDLNVPSFSELTFGGALGEVDRLVIQTDAPDAPAPGTLVPTSGTPWALYGSSMGGYLAARWAQLHPGRVEQLILLCPGFNIQARWPELMGEDEFTRWERDGWLEVDDAQGDPTPLHWEFVLDSRRHPNWPEVPCETLIIHGTRDETVPIEGSRQYAAERPHVQLIEVDDDHSLAGSLDLIADASMRFLGITS